MENEPCFLEMSKYHLSEKEARRTVIEMLLASGCNSPIGGWDKSTLTFVQPDKEQKITFKELVRIARQRGIVAHVQGQIDHSDEIFGGTFGFSTPTIAFGQVTTTFAGFTKVLKPPMTDAPVEASLSEDIMFYREETCIESNNYGFEMCTRNYRAYLTSCIALVDAFINRHILIYKFRNFNSPDFELLQHTSRLEDRLDLFMKISTGKDISAINGGTEWIHFKTLRRLRNEMTHINSPSLGYSIDEFADHLNFAKKGIGGLLKVIRNLQNKPSLGFIERIRTAPIVYFNEIIFKADGKHLVKRRN